MAFTVQKIANRYESEFGYHLTENDLAGKLVEDAVPTEHRQLVLDWIHEPGFYRDLPLMEDAQKVVYDLNKNYDVFVVSAANLIPSSVPEKLEWLGKNFGFIDVGTPFFAGSKASSKRII